MASTLEALTAKKYFMDQGWSEAQASGLVGNLQAESGFNLNPKSVGDGGKAYGIAQWHPDRQKIFKEEYGKPIQQSDLHEQLAFVQFELENNEKRAGNILRKSNDAGQSAEIVDKYYERSSGEHRAKRVRNAKTLDSNSSGPNNLNTPPKMSAADKAVSEGLTLEQAQAKDPSITAFQFLEASGHADVNYDDNVRTVGYDKVTSIERDEHQPTVIEYKPRPNPFMDFSTMTYSVSLYLASHDQYRKMMASGKKDVEGLTLFIQSGGASQTVGRYKAKRSKYFSNDYYIDDIKFESMISGTSTRSAHNTFTLKFKITEPAGITFFDNLQKMVEEESGNKNYVSQHYIMVIRFYGYDADGLPISGEDIQSISNNKSDATSVSEKFIPFVFTSIKFRLTDDKVEYSCEAVCPNSMIPYDKVRGIIPGQMKSIGKESVGGTGLESVLNNLAGNLSRYSYEIKETNVYAKADTYKIKLVGNALKKANILISDQVYLSTAAMSGRSAVELQYLNERIKVNIKDKEFHVQAGVNVARLIDVIVQTSSYITDQFDSLKDPNTGEVKLTGLSKQDFKWFKITTEAIPIEGDSYDAKRNDFAYDITYIISEYDAVQESEYVNTVSDTCFSIHKEYNYWFTGRNTEVLEFYTDFNFLWYSSKSQDYEKRKGFNHDINSNIRMAVENSGSGSNYNKANQSGEVAASIASTLYSPADMAMTKMTIVGDPDFIAQSELFYSPNHLVKAGTNRDPFLEDGSVNYDASEVYFTINYNTVVDYDLYDGEAKVNSFNVGTDINKGIPGVSRHSLVYRANLLTTILSSGKFIQEIQGTAKNINPKCIATLPLESVSRRENPNKKETPAKIIKDPGDRYRSSARLAPDINKLTVTPKNESFDALSKSQEASDENLNKKSGGLDIKYPDYLDNYVNNDNGYVKPKASWMSPDLVEEFKDYVDPDVELVRLENQNFLESAVEKGFDATSRISRGVFRDVEQFLSSDKKPNEDDN